MALETFADRLISVQSRLNAPKNQFNSFGGYSYRSCEDILEAVKPLLKNRGLYLTLSDEIILIGDRYYVKATASVTDGKEKESVTAYAREAATKKGMDESQVTGSASSYARKYALNGLFDIDDNKDRDTMDSREAGAKPVRGAQAPSQPRQAGNRRPAPNNTTRTAKAPGTGAQPPQRRPRRNTAPANGKKETKNWAEISKALQYQHAHCAECGKELDPILRAKSWAAYGNFFCSREHMDTFNARKAQQREEAESITTFASPPLDE